MMMDLLAIWYVPISVCLVVIGIIWDIAVFWVLKEILSTPKKAYQWFDWAFLGVVVSALVVIAGALLGATILTIDTGIDFGPKELINLLFVMEIMLGFLGCLNLLLMLLTALSKVLFKQELIRWLQLNLLLMSLIFILGFFTLFFSLPSGF